MDIFLLLQKTVVLHKEHKTVLEKLLWEKIVYAGVRVIMVSIKYVQVIFTEDVGDKSIHQ